MSCRYGDDDEDDNRLFDSNGCFHCPDLPRVKGRFGLAWVSETPECPNPEPVGWQVEFHDTPSRVETKCQEMVRWINCPPLPRCDPCPPDELCSPNNPPRCNPCAPMTNPCHPGCKSRGGGSPSRMPSTAKRCCCCGGRQKTRCFPPHDSGYCPRKRSPRRRGGGGVDSPSKCVCDDVPVKDTNISSGDYTRAIRIYPHYTSNSPQQARDKRYGPATAKDTITLYHNDKPYQTDTEDNRSVTFEGGGGGGRQHGGWNDTNLRRCAHNNPIAAYHRDKRVQLLRNTFFTFDHACDDCCERFMRAAEQWNRDCRCWDEEDTGDEDRPDSQGDVRGHRRHRDDDDDDYDEDDDDDDGDERKTGKRKKEDKKHKEKKEKEKRDQERKDEEKRDKEIRHEEKKDQDKRDKERREEEKREKEKRDKEKKDEQKRDKEKRHDEKRDKEIRDKERKHDEKRDKEIRDKERKDEEKRDKEKRDEEKRDKDKDKDRDRRPHEPTRRDHEPTKKDGDHPKREKDSEPGRRHSGPMRPVRKDSEPSKDEDSSRHDKKHPKHDDPEGKDSKPRRVGPRRSTSIDSLDEALMKMNPNQKLSMFADDHGRHYDSIDDAVVDHHGDHGHEVTEGEARKETGAKVEGHRRRETTTDGHRSRRRCRWLSPCFYNLCFRLTSSLSRDRDKSKKAKTKPKE